MAKKSFRDSFSKSTALQASALMVLWLLLSGHYDGFHIGLGLLSVVLVLVLNVRPTQKERSPVGGQMPKWGRVLRYVPWLVKEMIFSGVHVARVVITPRMPLDPSLIRFKSEQPNDVARVILGNSITLTPGTLTVDIGTQEFLVHALTRSTAEGLLNEAMQTRVARLFADDPERMVFDTEVVTSRARRKA